MNENETSGEDLPKQASPRTITITLPSWGMLAAAFLGGILLVSLVLGGLWGYRHLDHRQNLETARTEMAKLFKDRQAKAATLLEVAGRDAAQLQQDMSAALMATKSAAIVPADFATRQEGLAQDLANVQSVFTGLADEEQKLTDRYQLSSKDTLFSAENQEQFNQLHQQWQALSDQQAQLVTTLQAVSARKDSLLVTEEKAVALAAAKKSAQAREQAQAKARAQARQNAPVAVFGAPAYYNYSNRYYTAPIYQPNYQPYYYRRPYYGYGW